MIVHDDSIATGTARCVNDEPRRVCAVQVKKKNGLVIGLSLSRIRVRRQEVGLFPGLALALVL
jgi:hypothetical protein